MLADKIPLYSTYGLVGPLILKTTMQRNAFLTASKLPNKPETSGVF